MDANDLRKWRDANGYTQEELAVKLQVAANTISRWELGTRAIPSYLELALKSIPKKPPKK